MNAAFQKSVLWLIQNCLIFCFCYYSCLLLIENEGRVREDIYLQNISSENSSVTLTISVGDKERRVEKWWYIYTERLTTFNMMK